MSYYDKKIIYDLHDMYVVSHPISMIILLDSYGYDYD